MNKKNDCSYKCFIHKYLGTLVGIHVYLSCKAHIII